MKKLVLFALLAAVLFWAARHPYMSWRIGLIAMKLSRELPQIAWSDIPGELEGPIFYERTTGPGDESTGLVVFERQKEGACSHLWKTPIGSFGAGKRTKERWNG